MSLRELCATQPHIASGWGDKMGHRHIPGGTWRYCGIFLPVLAFALSSGYAQISNVVDLTTIPGDHAIDVELKSGSIYVFNRWTLDKDGNILGLALNESVVVSDSNRPRWSGRRVALDSVLSVRRHVASPIDIAKTSTVIVGVATITGLTYLIIESLRSDRYYYRTKN